MTLQARITEAIDTANRMLDATLTMPCRIESVVIFAEGRFAEVLVRFDNGGGAVYVTSTATLCPLTLLNCVHCAFMLDYLGLDPDPDEVEAVAYATGYQPPTATEDGRDITHAAPGVMQ